MQWQSKAIFQHEEVETSDGSYIKRYNLFGILVNLRVKFKVRHRHYRIELQKFSELEN